MGSAPIRTVLALSAVLVVSLVAAGCQPEPASTPVPSATSTRTAGSQTPSPSPSEDDQVASVELPASCEDLYSGAMFTRLLEEAPPLNDPGVTMLSTEQVTLIEILESGVASIRCTWGGPGEYGQATTVALVDDAQATRILDALTSAGFSCEDYAAGRLCAFAASGVGFDDQIYEHGEVHYVGGGGWVATNRLNVDVDGYTQDIVAHLWE